MTTTIETASLTLPTCSQPANVRVEGYSPADGRMHGSLDISVSACPDHDKAVADVLSAAGFTSYRMPMLGVGETRCGRGFDYRTMRGIQRSVMTSARGMK